LRHVVLASRTTFLLGAVACGLCLGSSAARAQLQSGPPQANFDAANWATGLTNATDIAFLADGRAVITLKGGGIRVGRDGDNLTAAGNITVSTGGENERGLLGVAALRSFRETPDGSEAQRTVFFFASVSGANAPQAVFRGVVQANNNMVVVDPMPITGGLAGNRNHNGGGLVVHKNHVYISVGDTGANDTPPSNKYSTCLNVPHGKILRVTPTGAAPADNPLSSVAMVTSCDSPRGEFGMAAPDKRIWAWGFRNPYRFWIDPITSQLWVGDVGEGSREEVSTGGKGQHFGYPFVEGTRAYMQPWNNNACMGVTPAGACVAPQHDWARMDGGPNCSIGGLIPDGDNGELAGNGKRLCGWPDDFKTDYFFGDHGSGQIWTADVKPDRSGLVANSVKPFAQVGNISSFRMGPPDALYLVSHGGNRIVRVTPKNYNAQVCAQQQASPDAGMPMGGASGQGGSGGGSGQGGSGQGGTSGQGGNAQGGSSAQGGDNAEGGATGGGGDGGAGDDDMSASDGGGCGCRVGAAGNAASLGALALGILGFVWLRRRRR
jgi:MYXO-CTERM domain-containing protein